MRVAKWDNRPARRGFGKEARAELLDAEPLPGAFLPGALYPVAPFAGFPERDSSGIVLRHRRDGSRQPWPVYAACLAGRGGTVIAA
ncbi:MAG: hypothetical protein LBQ62_00075 [Candidatus Accumulibacter sp.]|jgi:hypothetical protein|nr:hypothetical protein [Accumulibacter sp.]